jgi:hypothetical protein
VFASFQVSGLGPRAKMGLAMNYRFVFSSRNPIVLATPRCCAGSQIGATLSPWRPWGLAATLH